MFNGFYDGSTYYLFGYQSPYGYGAVYTSPDASTWTMQTYNNYFVGQNAVLANGKYFRLGNEGMLVSSDGLNWSYKWGGHFNDIIYDGANYIAAGWQGGDGAIWSSADLQTWTKGSLSAHSKMFYTVAFGNSTYVAIGDLDGTTTTLATSGNGTTWTKQTGINDSSYILDVAFGNGAFVAVGYKSDNSAPVLKTSANGVTWSAPTLPSTTSIQLNSVTYINNQFVAVGYDSTDAVMIWTSLDGTTWSDKSSTYPAQTDGLVNILYDGSKYILLGFDSVTYELFSRSSSDLSSWSSSTVLTGSAYTYNYSSQLGRNGNNIYVLSYDPTWTYIMLYYSDDQGQTWQDTGMDTSAILPYAISEVNNQLVISGDGQLVMAASSNAAPTVTGTALGQAVNDTATVSPFSGVTIADADADNVTATITLDSSAKGAFTAGSLTVSGFSTADGGTTYTHASATPGAMTTAIRALVYQPTANRVNPTLTETTTFSIAVNDGTVTTNSTNTTTVVSTSINDAPAVGGATAVTNINDNATAAPFSAFTIADADAAQTQSVSVTLDVAAKGSFTTLNGFANGGGGVYTFSGTAAAAQTAIQGLVFTPAANRVTPGSTETTTFTVSISDGIAAAATNNSTTVVSTSINDAPVLNAALSPALNGLGINPAAPSNGSTTGSTLVSALVAGISDVDVGAVKGIAITATDTVNGTLYYSTNAGTSWTTVGAVAAGSALLLASDANTRLYYQSNNGVSGNIASALTFRAWDQTTGTAASKVDTTTNGAATAFSTVTDTVSISIYPPPTIGGVTAGQTVTDKTTVVPFAATTIADSLGNNVTVIVTLDTQAKGSFTTLSGFTNNGNGSYTLTNVTAATAQTDIRGLVFTPTANRVAPGSTETATFTVGVTDVVTTIVATDATTTVVSTSINDAPTNTVVPAISGTATVGNILSAGSGTWTDVDPGASLSYSYQWYRANDSGGTGEVPIGGATANSYTITSSDAHQYLRVVVTANDGQGSADQTATSTRSVVTNTAPVNTVVPVISGTTTIGSLLSATSGTWTDADGDTPSYSYQWYRADDNSGTNEAAIPSATAGSYTLTVSDAHKYLRVVVTANDGHG
ncbi:MAG: hypothetical protein Q7W05_11825, partial [Deltaproteobacteria bacterium]|nr:hypothetical protein [Deltaproteobacteria bacterium]